MPTGLDRFNALSADAAVGELLSCCASPAWARRVAAGRPYQALPAMQAASMSAVTDLDAAELRVALDAHPRIGQQANGQSREAAWSRQEQSAASTTDAEVRRELVEGNVEYERRFGHVFLICATGRTAPEVLGALRQRLEHHPDREREVVRSELAKIVKLRLERLVEQE